MIAIPKNHTTPEARPAWHDRFMALVPAIKEQARVAFRHLRPEARSEAIQEVVVNACVAFRCLFELGKADLAYPTPLALYAIKQYREGRRTGTKSNCKDISSSYCQKKKGVGVGRLDRYDRLEQQWIEVLVEDRRSGPAEIVQAKLDIGDWMASLSHRRRKIAKVLAIGETTKETARKFQVSEGRISQVRR